LLTLYGKPRPAARAGLNYLWCLFFLLASVLAWIAFGYGIRDIYRGDSIGPHHCPWNYENTQEMCTVRKGTATIAITLDGGVGLGTVLCALLLAYYSFTGDWKLNRTGWREQERDADLEVHRQTDSKEARFRKVRNVRMWFLGIILFWTFCCVVTLTVFIIILHMDRDIEQPVQPYWLNGVRGKDLSVRPGWAARNTRLRYAATTVVILAFLINLIPFTHKAINFGLAHVYFFSAVLIFVCFGLDVRQMHLADKGLACPNAMKCVKAPFIATAIIEFLLGLALLVYVFYEFLCKCCVRSKWSQRHYAPHEISKHDTSLDSMRPVRCEVTGRPMTAKEYVYRWRFIAGTQPEIPPPVSVYPQIAPPMLTMVQPPIVHSMMYPPPPIVL